MKDNVLPNRNICSITLRFSLHTFVLLGGRINVAWADPSPYITGDDFSIGSSGSYHLDDIRIWVVKGANATFPPTSLYFGADGGSISLTSAAVSTTLLSYQYQGSSGNMLEVYQVDFAVNLNILGGQKYDFFIGDNLSTSPYYSPFVHASNAGLSGSTQDGADGSFLEYDLSTGLVNSWNSLTDGGWDKPSDINVQVFGSVPEPSLILLLGPGLIGLAALRRKF